MRNKASKLGSLIVGLGIALSSPVMAGNSFIEGMNSALRMQSLQLQNTETILRIQRASRLDRASRLEAERIPRMEAQYKADNPWYNIDNAMTAVAEAESKRLATEYPWLSIEQNLARTKVAVEAAFPHKFP